MPKSVRERVLEAQAANPWASGGQLARLLGMTRNQVLGQLHRAGISLARGDGQPLAKPHARVDATGCRFMIDNGDGCRDPNWRWCGKKEQPGSAYCPAHHARCYRRPEPESAAA